MQALTYIFEYEYCNLVSLKMDFVSIIFLLLILYDYKKYERKNSDIYSRIHTKISSS